MLAALLLHFRKIIGFLWKILRRWRLELSYTRDELRVEIARKRKIFRNEDSTYKNL